MRTLTRSRSRMLWLMGAVFLNLSCGPQGAPAGEGIEDDAIDTVRSALDAPTLYEAVPGDSKVTLRWSAGPPGTTNYQVRFRVGFNAWNYITVGASTTYTVEGLTNGTRYE